MTTNPAIGGRYVRKAGKLERLGGTQSHQDGDRPRDKHGVALNGPAAQQQPAAPAKAKAAPAAGGEKPVTKED